MQDFPPINATLNGTSAVLLVAAVIAIKARRVRTHATLIIMALVTSTTFLACYLTYHGLKARSGTPMTLFPADNPWRPVYLSILWTHTPLAVLIVPLIAITVWNAYKRRWAQHRKISWITFPLWLYVSVTGVVIYLMLLYSGAYGRH